MTTTMTAKQSKDSASIQERLAKTLELLKKAHKKAAENPPNSVHELLTSALTEEGVNDKEIKRIFKAFQDDYVDLNEVRVARMAEVARLMDPLANADVLAKRVKELLSRIFERTGNMSLDFMEEMKISEARRALAQIESVNRALADRILSMEVPAAAQAFSDGAVALAQRWQLIPKSGSRQQLQKIVSDHLEMPDRVMLWHLMETHANEGCKKSKCALCK
ncbi:MAG: hypothetical protein ACYTGH_13715 [Planctomycetota bacterium]|jgi:endonuclease III